MSALSALSVVGDLFLQHGRTPPSERRHLRLLERMTSSLRLRELADQAADELPLRLVLHDCLSSPRLRARRCDPKLPEGRTVGSWHIHHGGGVANAYKYRAETEVAWSLVISRDEALCGVLRLPANKVTLSGCVAAAFGPWSRPALDPRFGPPQRNQALAGFPVLARWLAGCRTREERGRLLAEYRRSTVAPSLP
jgi:hypothetical protein